MLKMADGCSQRSTLAPEVTAVAAGAAIVHTETQQLRLDKQRHRQRF